MQPPARMKFDSDHGIVLNTAEESGEVLCMRC